MSDSVTLCTMNRYFLSLLSESWVGSSTCRLGGVIHRVLITTYWNPIASTLAWWLMPLATCVSIPNFYSSFTLLKHTHLFPVPTSHPAQAVHLLGGLFFSLMFT